jgi:hypothetical protein
LGLVTYRLPNEAEGSQVCEAARWVQTLDFLEGFPGTWLNRFISVQKSQVQALFLSAKLAQKPFLSFSSIQIIVLHIF